MRAHTPTHDVEESLERGSDLHTHIRNIHAIRRARSPHKCATHTHAQRKEEEAMQTCFFDNTVEPTSGSLSLPARYTSGMTNTHTYTSTYT